MTSHPGAETQLLCGPTEASRFRALLQNPPAEGHSEFLQNHSFLLCLPLRVREGPQRLLQFQGHSRKLFSGNKQKECLHCGSGEGRFRSQHSPLSTVILEKSKSDSLLLIVSSDELCPDASSRPLPGTAEKAT